MSQFVLQNTLMKVPHMENHLNIVKKIGISFAKKFELKKNIYLYYISSIFEM